MANILDTIFNDKTGLGPSSAYEAPDVAFVFKSTRGSSVTLLLNPRSIRFSQGKRFSRQDTMVGTVFHHFSNKAGENNDILELAFEGNTGQIVIPDNLKDYKEQDQSAILDAESKAFKALATWHRLYALTREPMYFDKNVNGPMQKVRNRFMISYQTHLFPVPITFTGFFKEVLTFSENADKPRSRDYSMSFIVEDVKPSMNELANTLSSSGDTRSILAFSE